MADDIGETIEICPEKVVVYKPLNDFFANRNKKEHIGDVIYELKNKKVGGGFRNHMFWNFVKPDEVETKTMDIDGRVEKTIFYPKL